MQFEILIEETISDTFLINATTKEEAIRLAYEKYKKGEFLLAPGNLLNVTITSYAEDDCK